MCSNASRARWSLDWSSTGFEVLAASKNAAAGEFLFDTRAATAWLANRAREDFMGAVSALTEQEGELLRLLVAGHTDSQIALRMRLDEKAFRACLLALISKARTPRDDRRR